MNPPELWLVIPRWDGFQHPDTTRTGSMPWIKNFTRLLSDDAYLDLSWQQRGLLHSIWLEYARSRGQVRVKTGSRHVSLSRRLGQTVRFSQLEALNHAGWIAFSASKPASTTASEPASNSASTDVDRDREEKNYPVTVTAPHYEDAEPDPPGNGNGAITDKNIKTLTTTTRANLDDIPF